jgi:hypothetical protein
MRTTFIPTEEYGPITINHNSDWSGPVRVRWTDTNSNEMKEVWLPGVLLIALGQEAALEYWRSRLMEFLEE